ncbi:MAG: FAD-binding protein [bacterium]
MSGDAFDVAVIGGGLAGCAAALAARKRGASAALVSERRGATAMISGALDLAPSAGGRGGGTLEEGMTRLARANPYHPYAVASEFGKAGSVTPAAEALRESAGDFAWAMKSAGAGVTFSPGAVMTIAGSLGTARETRLCLDTMARGDLTTLGDRRAGFIGIAGFPEFDAEYMAAVFGTGGGGAGRFEAGWASATLPGMEGMNNLAPYAVARKMENAQFLGDFASVVIAAAKGKGFDRLYFPPVLGLLGCDGVLKTLGEMIGCECCETATAPPSVPGERIVAALRLALERRQVSVVEGGVETFEADGGEVKAVAARDPYGAVREVRASAFVLASGGFIGGGLRRDDSFRETVFDLPVFHDSRVVAQEAMSELVEPSLVRAHPVFSSGVRTDPRLTPLNERGAPAYENLFCAGSVLAGFDPFRDRCGAGVALTTGFLAGTNAAKAAKTA